MKTSLLTLGLVVAGISSGATAQPAATQPINLAGGKKFVSSDPNNRRWNVGLTDNSWVPAQGTTFATSNGEAFPKMVTLDLETAQTVGYIALGTPPFGSTKTVGVSLSLDGATFTEVDKITFAEAKEEKKLLSLKPISARYVRLTYLDHYPAQHGYSPTYAFTTELAVYAPGTPPVLPPTPTLPERADEPSAKMGANGLINGRFVKMHESFLERGKAGPIGVLFVGDSITEFWNRDNSKEIWAGFNRFTPANFGISGDKTQHVLWRIQNGELNGIKPKVVVLMIGTNNMRDNTATEIVQADAKIVAEIHRRLPETKLLLLGIFPRGAQATDPARAKIKQINAELAKLDDSKQTRFLDIGDKFLEADGSISKTVMPDALHPDPRGYQIWADAMTPLLDTMMQ